ncbi:MAG: hypothetical protein ACYCOR_01435 [Acidobacteriaceae bacterium]
MTRRTYRFMLKNSKEISFVGTRYFPVDIDPNLSPYTTVLATIWDDEHMVGQVNQTEILAWWSEIYREPEQGVPGDCQKSAPEDEGSVTLEKSSVVLLSSEN